MVDKIDLKQMEELTVKWVDLLTNNKSFLRLSYYRVSFSQLIDRCSRVFCITGVFFFLVGRRRILSKCLLDFLWFSLFLSSIFILLFWLFVFERGWAVFFLFHPIFIRSFVELRVDKRDLRTRGVKKKSYFKGVKVKIILWGAVGVHLHLFCYNFFFSMFLRSLAHVVFYIVFFL